MDKIKEFDSKFPLIKTLIGNFDHPVFTTALRSYSKNFDQNTQKAVKYGINSIYGIFGTGERKVEDYKIAYESTVIMLGALVGIEVTGFCWDILEKFEHDLMKKPQIRITEYEEKHCVDCGKEKRCRLLSGYPVCYDCRTDKHPCPSCNCEIKYEEEKCWNCGASIFWIVETEEISDIYAQLLDLMKYISRETDNPVDAWAKLATDIENIIKVRKGRKTGLLELNLEDIEELLSWRDAVENEGFYVSGDIDEKLELMKETLENGIGKTQD
jgi:hypothetical protein